MCKLAARIVGAEAGEILPSSTGIIGHMLPMEKVEAGILAVGAKLGKSEQHALDFGEAIMTTDTRRKAASAQFKVGRDVVTISGICKGAGMIGPRVAVTGPDGSLKGLHATMLAYLTTDAAVSPAVLRKILGTTAEESFNSVTIDDHMSTNDTACILASGASGAKIDSASAVKAFGAAMDEVCQSLAYQIAADGEGATKVVRIEVKNAKDHATAKAIARAIANSPLVKTAMHGNDPNWGRIVSAAGYAGVAFVPEKAVLMLQKTVVFKGGKRVDFDAGKVSTALGDKEVVVVLDCGMGKGMARVWTCDLSKEYITINADYHT
jgi:glutamate N-acetyltransferase/amino-acid N-acetyltransferase